MFKAAVRGRFAPALFALLWLAFCWFATDWAFESRSSSLIGHRTAEANKEAQRLADDIARDLSHLQSLPGLIAGEPEIQAAILRPGRRPLLDAANEHLKLASLAMDVSETFILDENGICIASSNHERTDSFVGSNYARREYARAAMQGGQGLQYAVGKTTSIPGLYFSSPISIGSRVRGVAVVKLNLSTRNDWVGTASTLLTDKFGVVILAADRALELHRVPNAKVMALTEQERLARYKRSEFTPLPLTPADTISGTRLYSLPGETAPVQWLRRSLSADGMELHTLQRLPSLAARESDRLQIFALVSLLGLLVLLMVRNRLQSWREHVRDQRRLRDSERRYHFLFDNNPLPMWVFAEDSLRFLEVNERAIEHYGYSHEEFCNMTIRDIRPADDIPELERVMSASPGRKTTARTRHRRKNGQLIDVWLSTMPMDYAGQPARVVLIEDISERVQAEAGLQQQLAYARALNEIARVVVAKNDPASLLEGINHLIGETLGCDRTLIYDVSFYKRQAIGMVEWLNPAHPGIPATKATYPLELFMAPASDIRRTRRWLVSQQNDVAAAMQQDGSGDLLHGQMKIRSLLWYPFAFREDGYFLLTLNHIHDQKTWSTEELSFLDSVSQLVNVAMDKIRLIAEREAAANDLRIAATAFESQEGMIITDADNRILRVNKAFTRITGYEPHEVLGQDPKLLGSGRQNGDFYADMWQQINAHEYWEGEIWNRRKNGEIYPEFLSIATVRDRDGKVINFVGSFSDITRRKNAEEEVRSLAFYDPLTHLPNRRLLLDRVQQTWVASQRNKRGNALLFIDLDNFKNLNDTLGHDVGDLLLQHVAERLTRCVRNGDTVARLGGDEFVVMLEDLSPDRIEAAEQTEGVGEKILAALNQPYLLDGIEYHNSPSIGATLFHDHQNGTEELFKHADIAMYQAKKAGKNTMRFFDPEMQEIISARAKLENEMHTGLELGQFELYYQLQVDEQHIPRGAEALIRWHHPKQGLITPIHFIPLAEESGLILPLGLWVLETACAQLKSWQDSAATRHLVLSVNVSAKQFRQPDFAGQLADIVRKHQIDPTCLKLELTESMLLDNTSEVVNTMLALRKIGVQFSLDDFGTGYSSLQYLKRLPLDQLKIDRSFVNDIVDENSDRAIVRTIIAMALELGMDVIAEGVETEPQLQLLRNKGCRHFQGYLFGRPTPISQLDLDNIPA
ncbi:MAG: EAL domain-containing protein [Sideroxydans sp.]|nr:EAL domain-containing protein [Sideroxydans sp.]